MQKLEKIKIQYDSAVSLTCNKCGKNVERVNKEDHIFEEEFFEVKQKWGYFSKEKDGTMESWDICQDCYDEFIKTFKYPVEVKKYIL